MSSYFFKFKILTVEYIYGNNINDLSRWQFLGFELFSKSQP